MIVTLNEAEIKLAEYLAASRNRYARSNGIPDEQVGKVGSEKIDRDGMGAEIAFCKMINVYPDTQVGKRNDADCHNVWMGGIDVKSTTLPHGRLLARIGKDSHPADSYALMVGELPSYKFVGWVPAAKLLHPENIIDLGHGPGYGLSQDKLIRSLPI